MHFQAQNPTASDLPLPCVPSNTVVPSVSPRANHDSKFIQFSFSLIVPFPRFNILSFIHQSFTETPEQHSVPWYSSQPASESPTSHNLGSESVQQIKLFYTSYQILHPVTDGEFPCRLNCQQCLPQPLPSFYQTEFMP